MCTVCAGGRGKVHTHSASVCLSVCICMCALTDLWVVRTRQLRHVEAKVVRLVAQDDAHTLAWRVEAKRRIQEAVVGMAVGRLKSECHTTHPGTVSSHLCLCLWAMSAGATLSCTHRTFWKPTPDTQTDRETDCVWASNRRVWAPRISPFLVKKIFLCLLSRPQPTTVPDGHLWMRCHIHPSIRRRER